MFIAFFFDDWSRAEKLSLLPLIPAAVGVLSVIVALRALRTTRTGMLLSHRPLVVVDPALVRSSDAEVVVTVRNIGPGVALNVYAECANIWQIRAKRYGAVSWGRATGIPGPLASGETAEIRLRRAHHFQTLRDPFRLRVVLRYQSLSDTAHWTDMFTGRDDDGWPTKTGNGKLPRPLRHMVPKKHPLPIPDDARWWRKAWPKVRHPRQAAREAWEWRALDIFEWEETDTPLGHVKAKAIVRELGTDVVALVNGHRFEYRTSTKDRDHLWDQTIRHATARLSDRGALEPPDDEDDG